MSWFLRNAFYKYKFIINRFWYLVCRVYVLKICHRAMRCFQFCQRWTRKLNWFLFDGSTTKMNFLFFFEPVFVFTSNEFFRLPIDRLLKDIFRVQTKFNEHCFELDEFIKLKAPIDKFKLIKSILGQRITASKFQINTNNTECIFISISGFTSAIYIYIFIHCITYSDRSEKCAYS